jgi:hypothetical protein
MERQQILRKIEQLNERVWWLSSPVRVDPAEVNIKEIHRLSESIRFYFACLENTKE